MLRGRAPQRHHLGFTRPYSSPDDLWNSLATQLEKKHALALRNLEIRVALADYKCAETVALLSTIQAMQARHARYCPKAYASALARLTRIDARALRIAKTVHLHVPGKR